MTKDRAVSLRVLVVDDSRSTRERIISVVESLPGGVVVGVATNGADALRLSRELTPDVVTLDLEMPEMGGFSFLRVLMTTRPLPVLVVSDNSRRENVIRALELGALDFIAKGDNERFGKSLAAKLMLALDARVARPSHPPPRSLQPQAAISDRQREPAVVIAIAASTGGPSALMDIIPRLGSIRHYAVLIAQHIPPRFSTAFAERLNRHAQLSVSEAKDGNLVTAGKAFVCPGDHCMELERLHTGQLRVRVSRPTELDRYVPNASRLLSSVGRAMGAGAFGVVLTGMGDDGADGARVIAELGGRVLVESSETAVIDGMPKAAARAVPKAPRVPLSILPEQLMALVKKCCG